MVSPRVWLAFGLLALLVISPLQAAENAACDAAELTLAQLKQQRQQLRTDRYTLQSIFDGDVPTPHQLNTLLGRPLNQRPLLPLIESQPLAVVDSKCPALQNDIDTLTQQVNTLEQSLYTLRQAFFGLNFPQRQAFLNLATHHTKLQTLADLSLIHI